MKTNFLLIILLIRACFHSAPLFAQQLTPYILNGSATQDNCNCYTLTPDDTTKAGSVWNKNKIDLTQSFNYIFNVYLGCKDATGADGVVFILQPISTSIGSTGQGLGFENIIPSIGIPIDTWQNLDFNDPWYDHIGIYKNGDLHNGTSNTLAGPVQAIADNPNIEDCQWHTLRIIWDAAAKMLSAEVDNVLRVQTNTDLVKNIFNNNPEVFWGFSAATGGASNVQKFCTSLNAGYSTPAGLKTCAPAIIPFTDDSKSFGTILNWWWDFGDGTQFNGQTPPPHAYPNPGYYTVKLNIEGNNGCVSDTLYKTITVGSIPLAGFKSSPSVICANSPALLVDTSYVQYGTLNQWNWNFNQGAELIQTSDSTLTKSFPAGTLQIKLTVGTMEGCLSDPVSKTLNITEKPSTRIAGTDACYGDMVQLNAGNPTPAIPIRQWYWFTGDGQTDSTAQIQHLYTSGGVFTAAVYAVNNAGCSSDTATVDIHIYQTKAKIGNDTVVAFGQPLQLQASGGDFFQWTPAAGLNNPTIANPVAMLDKNLPNIQYIVTATVAFGCPTYDTIQIKAYKGPAIYMPNAFSPDNNGVNDLFHPVPVGLRSIDYFEVFNRLGQRVYESHTIGNGWDGTLNGKPQPMGTYVWMIKGIDYLGNIQNQTGTVVLIR